MTTPQPDTSSIYGWAGKIGLVIPSNNTVIEPEFWAARPDRVTVHSARVLSHGNTPEGIVMMERNVTRAVKELDGGSMSVIAYACLATSLVKGKAWDDAIRAEIHATTGRPATTAAAATVAAVKTAGATRIGIATPYTKRIGALVAPFFESCGLAPLAVQNLEIEDSREIWKTTPATLFDLAVSANVAGAEAICILATDLPTMGVTEAIAAELGKPVITTNAAILWQCLALAGIATETHQPFEKRDP
jgi:maleate isomerase